MWKNDQRDGFGIQKDLHYIYEGNWEEGKRNDLEGKLKTIDNFKLYEGPFIDDEMNSPQEN